MAFLGIYELDLRIMKYICPNFKLLVSLCFLNKTNYEFVTGSRLYQELIVLKNRSPKNFNKLKIIVSCCSLGFVNLLKIMLKKFKLTGPILYKKSTCQTSNTMKQCVLQAIKCNHLNILKVLKKVYPITKHHGISIDCVLKNGNIRMLEFLKESGFDMKFMHARSLIKTGRIDVLKWYHENYNLKFPHVKKIIEISSDEKHVNILEYLYKFYKEPKYFDVKLDSLFAIGNVNVLEWYRVSDIKLKYTKNSIDDIVNNGHVSVLDWLKTNGINFVYSDDIIDSVKTKIFDWSNSYLEYSKKTIDMAAKKGNLEILNWFVNSGLNFKYKFAIDDACKGGHINILEWFHNSNFKFKYTSDAIDNAASKGHIDVLNWFLKNEFEFKYSEDAIDLAAENGHLNILNWFHESIFEFKYTKFAIDNAAYFHHIEVIEWFQKNNYEFEFSKDLPNEIDNDEIREILTKVKKNCKKKYNQDIENNQFNFIVPIVKITKKIEF